MKALVLKDYRRLVIEDVPVPAVGPEDVLVRVRACGICGSDVHGFDGSTGRRRPPLIMGHEASGEIARTGTAVSRWKVGDRVTMDSTVYCGRCWHCLRGEFNLCDERQVLGVSCEDYRRDGAFAEFVAVPERILYRLPDPLSFERSALAEAVSVAVHAVRNADLEKGSAVAVIGSGMIGLLVIQVLRAAGCSQVIAVDLDDSRLELARRLGATAAVNSGSTAPAAAIRQLTDGRGADAAFEVVGISSTLGIALESVRKGGRVTLVGNLQPKVDLPLQAVVTREITIIGSCASSGEYPESLELIASGKVDVGAFISATPPLEEGPAWFDRLHGGEKGLMKVILRPSG
jgi:L-iditol 2-dehydrogenase